VWEADLLGNLLGLLNGFVSHGGRDGWVWRLGEEGIFSINSCYSFNEKMYLGDGEVSVGEREVFRYLWKGQAPSTVLAFSWSMMLDKIPIRVIPALRGVLDVEGLNN